MSVFLALHLGWVQNSVFTGWWFRMDLNLLKDTHYVRMSELSVQYKNILFKFIFIFIWQCQLWSVKTLFWSIQSYFYMRNILTKLICNSILTNFEEVSRYLSNAIRLRQVYTMNMSLPAQIYSNSLIITYCKKIIICHHIKIVFFTPFKILLQVTKPFSIFILLDFLK